MRILACRLAPLLVLAALGGCGNTVTVNTAQDLAVLPDSLRPPDLATPCGACPPTTPVCDTGTRQCVGCLADKDCPDATVCRNKQCQPGCSATRSECGDAGSCDLDAGLCHGCLSDGDCKDAKAPACDVISGRCFQCVPANDKCPAGAYCAQVQGGYGCMLGCRADAECQQALGANGGCCNHQCVDLATSKDNCGACNAPCGNGACCGMRCVNNQTDVLNCGACGKSCPMMNNQPQCAAGACSTGSCLPGFADCDGMAGNGCEVGTGSDLNNCGGCGKACAAANANLLCLNGGCVIGACKPGYRDCNSSFGDGCEVNIMADPVNCGMCGASCGAVPHANASCSNGACAIGQCDAGFGNCNGIDNDGCEADITSDQKNCGGCGKACAGPPNTVISCVKGVCGNAGGCLPGFKDCDNNAQNGCEVNIYTDANNCGACGGACGAVPNGVASCTLGVCGFACNKGFGDCDGNKNNGCEVTLNTDKNNCGTCGTVCPMNAPLCVNGKCSNIVRSCKEVLDGGLSVGDGVYMIDPDGAGANPPFQIYCDMTTDGGGWEVQAYIRNNAEWDWLFYTDNGAVGDTANGFSSGLTLKSANDSFNEKIIIYKNLIENGASLGQQFMVLRRADNAAIPFNTLDVNATGWSFRDSFGKTDGSAGNVCTHGCGSYRTHGMFHDFSGIQYHGTQGGNYGCRDGNNICWMSRGQGCNVGAGRCAYLTGQGEGVLYGVRNKP